VLSWIQYSTTDLEKKVKEQIEAKVREGVLKPREGVDLQNFYEGVLHGYTYVDYEKQARVTAQAIAEVARNGMSDSGGQSAPSSPPSTLLN
jgi:hypothetical protein